MTGVVFLLMFAGLCFGFAILAGLVALVGRLAEMWLP